VRIPFPERVPLNRVAIFAGSLFAIQMFQGTPFYFSAGCVAFILIAAFAFNAAGGLTRSSGAYVFFYSLLVVIVGLCYKAYLGERADSNLLVPQTDILAYVGSITAMLVAVLLSRRLSRKSGLMQNLLKESGMYRASVGCIVFGVFGVFLIALLGEEGASINRAFTQINYLIPLGIIIGVMYEIRHTHGRRSVNLPVVFSIVFVFVLLGLFSFSKSGMLLPLICWVLPVCALRYRLTSLQMGSCMLALFIIFHYLTPYADYGRNFRGEANTIPEKFALTVRLLEHPEQTRQKYLDSTIGDSPGYYNTPQGFWGRLQFISVDDALINITDHGHVFGLWPIKAVFLNAIPHVIWPNKPPLILGNNYMHEINGQPLDEGDTSTGISFSATGEAYHWAKWVGILVVAPLIWLLLFVALDSLIGDIRTSPWGLLVLAMLSHTAPEGMLSGAIAFLTFGVEAIIFCALFATFVAPLFATAVLGPERRTILSPMSPGNQPAQRFQP
jgi:hypothetical protein